MLANGVDPDQTPHNVASDLGLYCLPMTLLRMGLNQMETLKISECKKLDFRSNWTYSLCVIFYLLSVAVSTARNTFCSN